MENNNTVSRELRDEIADKASSLLNARNYNNPVWNAGFYEGYETGATKYASKWQQSEAEKKVMEKKHNILCDQRDSAYKEIVALQDQNKQLREALERAVDYLNNGQTDFHEVVDACEEALDITKTQLPSEGKGQTDSNEDGVYVTQRKRQLAEKINARIMELGLTRQEFAEQMGAVPSSITKWLSGQHNFEIKTLFEIERVLGFALFK